MLGADHLRFQPDISAKDSPRATEVSFEDNGKRQEATEIPGKSVGGILPDRRWADLQMTTEVD
jgi:hypothetical protein